MTHIRLRLLNALAALRWSYAELAEEVDVSPATVRRWANELYVVPPDVLDWLERLAKAHRDDPAPRRHEKATPCEHRRSFSGGNLMTTRLEPRGDNLSSR